MDRPRLFRDPIHGQIRFKRGDLSEHYPSEKSDNDHIGWLIPNLINSQAFQRLRHIRQNGLTNLVFHGMEHSRFSHSMGVSFLAGEMYDRVTRNSGVDPNGDERLSVVTAGLLHDIGHGPFSHTMEEVLKEVLVPFHHENMTERIILEDPEVRGLLEQVDGSFPERIAAYINKKRRSEDHWTYRLISSQLDADRIDYLLRDAHQAGLVGHGFDVPRLLDMLYAIDERIVVDRHATEAVEAYLIMLYHVYQAIYFHRGVRGATVLLTSLLRRAADVYKNGDYSIFPNGASNFPNPFRTLLEQGDEIDIDIYLRIGEFHLWQMIEDWQFNKDHILSDLSRRLMRRQRFRARDFSADDMIKRSFDWQAEIAEIISRKLPLVSTEQAHKYYMSIDTPERVGYKLYNWANREFSNLKDDAIWLFAPDREDAPNPIENEHSNGIFNALKTRRHYSRLMFPVEAYSEVIKLM